MLGIDVSATSMPDTFSSDNIEIAIGVPVGGRVKFAVTPDGAPSALFLRVKVK